MADKMWHFHHWEVCQKSSPNQCCERRELTLFLFTADPIQVDTSTSKYTLLDIVVEISSHMFRESHDDVINVIP